MGYYCHKFRNSKVSPVVLKTSTPYRKRENLLFLLHYDIKIPNITHSCGGSTAPQRNARWWNFQLRCLNHRKKQKGPMPCEGNNRSVHFSDGNKHHLSFYTLDNPCWYTVGPMDVIGVRFPLRHPFVSQSGEPLLPRRPTRDQLLHSGRVLSS